MITPMHYHPGLRYDVGTHRVVWSTSWVRCAHKLRALMIHKGSVRCSFADLADRIGERCNVVAAVLSRLADDGCVAIEAGSLRWVIGTVEAMP